MNFQCLQCDISGFSSHQALKEHRLGGHVSKPENPVIIKNPPLNDPEEFAKTLAEMRAQEEQKALIAQTNTESLKQASPIPIAPLQLKYIWTGTDDKGHTVKTINVDTEAGFYVIAFCLSCDKEIDSMKVAKLDNYKLFLRDKNTGEITPLQTPAHQTNIASVNPKKEK